MLFLSDVYNQQIERIFYCLLLNAHKMGPCFSETFEHEMCFGGLYKEAQTRMCQQTTLSMYKQQKQQLSQNEKETALVSTILACVSYKCFSSGRKFNCHIELKLPRIVATISKTCPLKLPFSVKSDMVFIFTVI